RGARGGRARRVRVDRPVQGRGLRLPDLGPGDVGGFPPASLGTEEGRLLHRPGQPVGGRRDHRDAGVRRVHATPGRLHVPRVVRVGRRRRAGHDTPQGGAGGGDSGSSEMISAVKDKNAYVFDYVATPTVPAEGGPSMTRELKTQHFRTIFTLLPFKDNAGLTLVTITIQTTQDRILFSDLLMNEHLPNDYRIALGDHAYPQTTRAEVLHVYLLVFVLRRKLRLGAPPVDGPEVGVRVRLDDRPLRPSRPDAPPELEAERGVYLEGARRPLPRCRAARQPELRAGPERAQDAAVQTLRHPPPPDLPRSDVAEVLVRVRPEGAYRQFQQWTEIARRVPQQFPLAVQGRSRARSNSSRSGDDSTRDDDLEGADTTLALAGDDVRAEQAVVAAANEPAIHSLRVLETLDSRHPSVESGASLIAEGVLSLRARSSALVAPGPNFEQNPSARTSSETTATISRVVRRTMVSSYKLTCARASALVACGLVCLPSL
ncbi:hypothetical protein THAOC_16726, partial [Thalassiosira oceanica]